MGINFLERAGVALVAALICVCLPHGAAAAEVQMKPSAGWKSRTVYQIMTDRFATDDRIGRMDCDLNQYCGGTFKGMLNMVEYVQGLGVDALWISPITAQGPEFFGKTGYHGFWPSNFYSVNDKFGTTFDLKDLVKSYKDKGFYMMFDQVINHVGYGDFTRFTPFNESSDFHDCKICYSEHCLIDPKGPFYNFPSTEHCRISGLPDLNHSDPSVAARLLDIQQWTDREFAPDAFRYDAAHHSLQSLVKQLTTKSRPWTIGEIFVGGAGDPWKWSVDFIADWVKSGAVDSAFSFPMMFAVRNTFMYANHGLDYLVESRAVWRKALGAHIHTMGSFIENHDIDRWIKDYPDTSRYWNGLVYTLYTEGIPFIYYGSESGLTGTRDPLWYKQFTTDNPTFDFLHTSIQYRKAARIWEFESVEDLHVDNSSWVFARGPFVVVLTNVGAAGPTDAGSSRTLQKVPIRFARATLRDIYNPESQLTIASKGVGGTARKDGSLVGTYTPDKKGNPQVFCAGALLTNLPPESLQAGNTSKAQVAPTSSPVQESAGSSLHVWQRSYLLLCMLAMGFHVLAEMWSWS